MGLERRSAARARNLPRFDGCGQRRTLRLRRRTAAVPSVWSLPAARVAQAAEAALQERANTSDANPPLTCSSCRARRLSFFFFFLLVVFFVVVRPSFRELRRLTTWYPGSQSTRPCRRDVSLPVPVPRARRVSVTMTCYAIVGRTRSSAAMAIQRRSPAITRGVSIEVRPAPPRRIHITAFMTVIGRTSIRGYPSAARTGSHSR